MLIIYKKYVNKGPHQNLNKFPSKVFFMINPHWNYLESYLDKVGGGGGPYQ